MCEQAVVRKPLVANRSLMPSGMPSSGRAAPLGIRASLALAISSARSGVGRMKAFSALARPIASRWARVSSSADSFLRASARHASAMESSVASAITLLLHGLALDEGRVGFGLLLVRRRRVFVLRRTPLVACPLAGGFRLIGGVRILAARIVGVLGQVGDPRDVQGVFVLLLDREQVRIGVAALVTKRGCYPTRGGVAGHDGR